MILLTGKLIKVIRLHETRMCCKQWSSRCGQVVADSCYGQIITQI